MLDEFPALGRLDFFEIALAFMAGYGVRAFLIAQSLNQIEKAYGDQQLDPRQLPCPGRVRDQRRAHRQAHLRCARHRDRAARDAQLCRAPAGALARAMSWSRRQETARPLLTPGEVMQLPPTDEIVMVSGHPPVRAHKIPLLQRSELHSSTAAAAATQCRSIPR